MKIMNDNERSLTAEIAELADQVPRSQQENILWALQGMIYAANAYAKRNDTAAGCKGA